MLIKNLSKEVDAKAMTAVRGGSYDSVSNPVSLQEIFQTQINNVHGNDNLVDDSQSATASAWQPSNQFPGSFVISGLTPYLRSL